jgi:hypothetical protein
MPKQPKHHYVPAFYLKQWAGSPHGRIVEFSRPFKNIVKPRWTSPDGTGYIRGLNLISTLPPEQAERFETVILQKVDGLASSALQKLLSDHKTPWTPKPRSAWTRFLVSILLRNPEALNRAIRYMQNPAGPDADKSRKIYDEAKGPNDLPFEEFLKLHGKQAALLAILQLLNNKKLGTHINTMTWSVLILDNVRFPLLTSDRPLITTNGVGLPNSHIIMPLSPTKVFVAINDLAELARLQSLTPKDLAESINLTVVNNAVSYVWATNERQLRFVQNRMSSTVGSDEWLMAGLGPKI